MKKHDPSKNLNAMHYIPVVDTKETMNLMYMIKVSEIMDYCKMYFGFVEDNLNPTHGNDNNDNRFVKIPEDLNNQ